MFRFPQQTTPAVQDFMNAQYALFSDMSQRAFESLQKIGELNVQLTQSMMEELLKSTQQVLVARDPYEAASIAAARAQPAAEKWRSYQQSLAGIMAETQADVAKAVGSRMPAAGAAASATVDEAAQYTKDQTDQALNKQKSALDKSVQGAASGLKQSSIQTQPS